MAARIRDHDWGATPLGPITDWPQSLRTAVDIVIGSGHAMQLAWGAERTILYNDAYAPMLGERHPAAIGRPFRAAWPDIWDEIAPLVDRVFAGETVRFEDMPLVMTRHGYPEDTWWNFSYSPVRGEDGGVAGLLNVTIDATPKKRAERAEAELRAGERDQAFLLEFSDAIRAESATSSVADRALRLVAAKLGLDRCYLVSFDLAADRAEFPRQFVRDGFAPLPSGVTLSDFPASVKQVLERTLVIDDADADPALGEADRASLATIGQRSFVAASQRRGPGNPIAALVAVSFEPRHWTSGEVALIEEVAERTWAAIEHARAEAAQRQNEDRLQALVQHQSVLVAELQHRVRNILTVVRSVFGRTIEAGGGLEQVADHFRGRLDSLARTQVVVTQSAAGDVDLQNLIRDELLSVGAAGNANVTIVGPDVRLSAKTAESIGMAIHELTTNAIKYGALSAAGGELRIEWTQEKTDPNLVNRNDLRLVIRWTEQGVRAVDLRPARRGFGSELIEDALPYRLGAETSLEFRGGGVRCTISMPVPAAGAAAASA